MRKILFFLFILSIQNISFGQKTISGNFHNSKKDIGFESDIFQLKKDGTFRYVFFTCTGTGFGKGNYEITKNDSLKLYFKDCEDFENNGLLKISTKNNDSLQINLKIVSTEDGDILPGANCVFLNTKKGFSSDIDGNASITIPKLKEDIILEISFLGLENKKILISKETSEITGTVKLSSNVWTFSREESKSFKILNISSSKIRLQRYPNRSISYDRISSKKADKMVQERVSAFFYNYYTDKIAN